MYEHINRTIIDCNATNMSLTIMEANYGDIDTEKCGTKCSACETEQPENVRVDTHYFGVPFH